MKRLFIELYLDEDVSLLLAQLLTAHGFSVTTAKVENQLGRSDEEQLAFAAEQGRAIITHNRSDFEALARQYFDAQRSHAGIIIAVRRSPYEILSRLLKILDSISATEIENVVLYI